MEILKKKKIELPNLFKRRTGDLLEISVPAFRFFPFEGIITALIEFFVYETS